MMNKIKSTFTNWRILILVFFLIISIVAINPHPGREGLAIRSIDQNSSAWIAGMQPPKAQDQPVSRELLISINNKPIATLEEYEMAVSELTPNMTVYVKTDRNTYRLVTKEHFISVPLNETERVVREELIILNRTLENGSVEPYAQRANITITQQKMERRSLGTEDLGIGLYNAPKSNLRKGLDLQGGTRVLLQPEVPLSPDEMGSLIDTMTERLNVYGLSDIAVKEAGDLSGNQYVLVEVAGASESEIRELLAKQGKFEARIGEQAVFKGGQEITFVCRSANCAGLDPNRGCVPNGNGYTCGFYFSITLSKEAAEKQAEASSALEVVADAGGSYLSKPLDLYLDDNLVDSLSIAADLRGQAVQNIQISGSGMGQNQEAAAYNTLQNMKRLQTILITGSLPVKLNIVKADAISPVLGEGFLKNAIIMALVAILAVAIAVAIRYTTASLSGLIIVTMISEIVIVLGLASFIGWNIDLAAIAGIIAAIGTGVDHQIVIADEALRGGGNSEMSSFNWRDRIKKAFAIIMLSYATVTVAMLPLVFAGAGLLKGFAITTILAASIGVFITRPAFSHLLQIWSKN